VDIRSGRDWPINFLFVWVVRIRIKISQFGGTTKLLIISINFTIYFHKKWRGEKQWVRWRKSVFMTKKKRVGWGKYEQNFFYFVTLWLVLLKTQKGLFEIQNIYRHLVVSLARLSDFGCNSRGQLNALNKADGTSTKKKMKTNFHKYIQICMDERSRNIVSHI